MPKFLYALDMGPTKVGGLEIFVSKLAASLSRHNWKTVLCFSAPPTPVVAQLMGPDVAFEVLAGQSGLSLRSAAGLHDLLRKHRPHAFMYAFNGVLRLYPWVARLAGIESISYNDHSSRPEGYVSKPFGFPKQWLARVLTAPVTDVVSVSEYPKRMLAAQGICAAPNHVIWNGVDLTRRSRVDRRDYLARFEIPSDRTIVTQVSWLVPEKGVDILLRAARIVTSERKDVQFVLVGDGPFRADYEALARSLGIESYVTFTGKIADPCAEGVYSSSDISCLISRWQEACPLAVMEAMSFGLPTVVSDRGAMPNIIEEGQTGYAVTPREDLVAARILELLQDPQRRRSMGRLARERAQSLLTSSVWSASTRTSSPRRPEGLASQE